MLSFHKRFALILYLLLLYVGGKTQPSLPYKNAALPIAERVQDLLRRMTPEEKFWQLFMIPGDLGIDKKKYRNGIFGFQVSAAAADGNASQQMLRYNSSENAAALAKKINAIQKYFVEETRLGIPIIAFDESLHGLVRNGATAFPQAIGLAASWDTALMARVANAIAYETAIRGIRQVLSPVINIATDPRWGRTEETYGEDPFLTAEMGVAFMSAFEKRNIITTPKHFLANVGDGGRDSYPIHANERYLEEIHLPSFKAAFERAGARSVMTSYNSIDGSPATASNWLLNKKLKQEWGFKGFVISDASAVGGANVLHFTAKDYPDAGRKAITNGLDVIFQTAYEHHTLFDPPFLNGAIDQKRIDDAVARVLTAKFELGLFEHPYVAENPQQPSQKTLARDAAAKSIVLLKNENNVLPLHKNTRSIALIGTDAVEARLGGYSGPGNGKINIADGIKTKWQNSASLFYASGPGRKAHEWETIPSKFLSTAATEAEGLQADYYSTLDLSGTPVLSRVDKEVDFKWTLYSPAAQLPNDHYAVRWTGKIKAPTSGNFSIGLDGNDGYRLYIDNKLVIDQWQKQSHHTRMVNVQLEKDRRYDLRVEFYEAAGNADIRLIWNVGVDNNAQQKIDEAVAIAKKAEVVIIVAGIEEGEFRDRAMLSLPGKQEALINAIAQTGKPVIVLLVGGSAVTMPWLDKIAGLLDVWYPGEEGGNAVADVLFGEVNPAARLPITFPVAEAQLPLVYNHKPTGRGDDYHNLSGQPLFPFGFGLSYTTFSYSNIALDKKEIRKNGTATISCNITNTGKRDGEEVVQLYIRDVLASVARPVMELKGFQRIALKAGETRRISFSITPAMLEMLNEQMQHVVEPGDFRIMIGSSSRDLWLKEILRVTE